MTEQVFIPLEKIKPNPYQPRTVEDVAAIAEIAVNIYRNGLMQVPSARKVNGHYELVFGHTRMAAYKMLAETGVPAADIQPDENFASMPLNLHDLDDRQMFEMAVAENIKRRDLNPIEQAQAMKRYMAEFDATSKQAAELFGVNDATVRGKVRLLDLPEQVQGKLSAGEISEGVARMLLSAQKLVRNESDLLNLLDQEKGDVDMTVEWNIKHEVENLDNVFEMWSDSRGKEKPRSHWRNGWLLDARTFPNKYLPQLTVKEIMDIAGDDKQAESLLAGFLNNGLDVEDYFAGNSNVDRLREVAPNHAEILAHLINPPAACTTCPYFARIDGTYLCGLKVCHQRKSAAYKQHLFEQMSKKLGIAIYSETDGKYRLLESYDERHYYDKRNKDLRLLPKADFGGHRYQSFPEFDSELGWVVLTGETLAKQSKKSKTEKETEAALEQDDPESIIESILERANHALGWAAAEEVAKLFEGMNAAIIDALYGAPYGWRRTSFMDGQEPEEESRQQVLWIAMAMVDHVWNEADPMDINTAKGIADAFAHHCKPLGVKLPKSFFKLAESFDTEIASVSVETKAKKKK